MKNNNPFRLSLAQFCEQEGIDWNDPEWLEEITFDSVAPACCTEGCEVEPDGYCEHGCPSVLLVLGLV
jgi:hypothetical protein